MFTTYERDTCIETFETLAFVMEVYSSNIPGIYQVLEYAWYIPGIFHTYDTMQIPDGTDLKWAASQSF